MRKLAFATLGLGIIFSGGLIADNGSDLAARKLFYQDNQPEVVFRAVAVSAKPPVQASTPSMPAPPRPMPQPVRAQRADVCGRRRLRLFERGAAQLIGG